MKRTKEVLIGVFAILAIAIAVWGYNYLKGTNLFVTSKTVYAVYPNIGGLAASSPVLINGYNVGIVRSTYFHPNLSGNVVVELMLTEDKLKIPTNSIAKLISTDFLGSKAIELLLGNSSEEIQEGDTLAMALEESLLTDVSNQIVPIKEKAEKAINSIDTAMISINNAVHEAFSYQNKKNLRESLDNLRGMLESLTRTSETFNASLQNTVNPNMNKLGILMDTLNDLSLKSAMDSTRKVLGDLSTTLSNINSGQGTMGKLMTDDSLYNNLEAVTRNLDKLLIDFNNRPKRYVHFSLFGKKSEEDKKNKKKNKDN